MVVFLMVVFHDLSLFASLPLAQSPARASSRAPANARYAKGCQRAADNVNEQSTRSTLRFRRPVQHLNGVKKFVSSETRFSKYHYNVLGDRTLQGTENRIGWIGHKAVLAF
jgi:hypothetical protein